ncbi:MAG: alkaline phosphatase family protein, partial [Acidobacteriota bacterium]|nr:alkaline phosphatase family protein [Acidobacteriota bacterium]
GVSSIDNGAPYCPNLAQLKQHGLNYLEASTSRPSDSFPGLMAIVTGGSPRTFGAFYDVAYDRVLAPPQNTTGNGVAGGTCTPNVPNGTRTEFEEGVDLNPGALNGGGPYNLTDGGIKSIDPTLLPRDPFNNCAPVYPWNFIRTNTIYGVIHAAHGYTAWSDKHPVYAAVSGPGNNASNVDDYYSPEINSNVIALPGVTTATGVSCASVRDTTHTGSWTDSFLNIQCYDTLKVNAIVNEIRGKTHDGAHSAPVPALFGMNFQAVSVGEKLIENGVKGGYLDAAATTSDSLRGEIVFADASIGKMVAELKKQGLLDSTLVIVTAKHGQSSIDPNRFVPIPGHSGTNGASPATLIQGMLPWSESPANPTGIGPTEDDISLLWLQNSTDTAAAVATLEANAASAGIGQIFYGPSLETVYGVPGLPPTGDPRTPDIIVQPNVGVIYTGSTKKQEEHGGFAQDDTNVMLLVSNPNMEASTVHSFVETMQVAPTILQALGLDPNSLQAVQKEGTPVLPGLNLK